MDGTNDVKQKRKAKVTFTLDGPKEILIHFLRVMDTVFPQSTNGSIDGVQYRTSIQDPGRQMPAKWRNDELVSRCWGIFHVSLEQFEPEIERGRRAKTNIAPLPPQLAS
jgi:hypothetical protein